MLVDNYLDVTVYGSKVKKKKPKKKINTPYFVPQKKSYLKLDYLRRKKVHT
jgi:hypothetical protein